MGSMGLIKNHSMILLMNFDYHLGALKAEGRLQRRGSIKAGEWVVF